MRGKIDWRAELSRQKYRMLGIVCAVTLVVDQWTKHLVHTRFRWGESIAIWNDYFALTYVRNTGAAFGFLHKAPAWFREPFFIIIPIVALVVILMVYAKLKDNQKVTAFALSLILGGAVGNLIDRLRFGYVIDFLDFHWKNLYHWPAFNVADSCIVVGVCLMFLLSFQQEGEGEPSGARPPALKTGAEK